MKKKRGLRRYFKSLNTRETKIPLIWLKDGYFSYDKLWVDYYGFTGIKKRKPHLEYLFRNYEMLSDQISNLNQQFQIWIWINELTSREDCIILHSPNPFNSFPHKYKSLTFDNNFNNTDLLTFINQKTEFKKIYGTRVLENENGFKTQENFCVLYKDNIGEPII
jgi:hypothetical protein